MTIDDEEREATRELINGLRSGVNVAAAEIKSQREQLDTMRQQLATVTAERDDYMAKFRELEHELSLERGQVILMQQRAEATKARVKELEEMLTEYGFSTVKGGAPGEGEGRIYLSTLGLEPEE